MDYYYLFGVVVSYYTVHDYFQVSLNLIVIFFFLWGLHVYFKWLKYQERGPLKHSCY